MILDTGLLRRVDSVAVSDSVILYLCPYNAQGRLPPLASWLRSYRRTMRNGLFGRLSTPLLRYASASGVGGGRGGARTWPALSLATPIRNSQSQCSNRQSPVRYHLLVWSRHRR